MSFKKFISGVSAFAIAASAFVSLAVTASAYTVSLSADVTVAGYKDATFYNFQTNDPEVLPTTGDLRYRDGGTYGLHNFGSGTRSAAVSIPVQKDDILLIETYNTNGQAVSASINCGTANAAVTTSSGYTAFDIATDATSVTFTVNRYTGIMGAVVLNKDTAAATADYTVKYVDENSNTIKADLVGNGVVGAIVPVDTASFVENDQKYIYVSDNSADNTIAADGSTVVTVIYRAAANYSYSVIADQGNTPIASGTAFEGDTVKVAYPKYVNVDGTLYEKGATNKEYNHSFTLDGDNKVVTLGYTAPSTAIENVVFLAEGEDIAGLTASTATNTKIRSSKSGSGYATADTTIANLPAGKYQIHAALFSASSGGANLPFTFGANEFNLVSTENTNWKDVTTDEITVREDSDLVMKAGGGNNAALDFIYVVKTGEYVPAPQGQFSVIYKTEDGTTLTKTSSGSGDVDSAPVLASADKADFVEDGQKYTYVSDDSADVKIAADNSAVVTVICAEIPAVTEATVNYISGDNTVVSETATVSGAFVGESYAVPYRRYVAKDGVLYEAAATNKEFRKTITLGESNVVDVAVTAVTVAEGETFVAVADGDGDPSNTADVRASNASAKRGTLEIAAVEPGVYKIVYNMYLRKQGDGPELFLNETSLGLITTGSSWTTDVTFENIEVTEAGTLSIHDCDMLDTVVLYKTGDVEPQVQTETITIGDVSGDGKINSTDLLQLGRHVKGTTGNKGHTGEVRLKADGITQVTIGDVSGDAKINSTDLLQLGRHVKGTTGNKGHTGEQVEVLEVTSAE